MRSRQWLANRRATGTALTRALLSGERDARARAAREAAEAYPTRALVDSDPHERAGHGIESLESRSLEK